MFQEESNRIFLNNDAGEMVAEVTFPAVSEHKVVVDHTFVDDSLRGQGVAEKLMVAIAEKFRKEGLTFVATCSYAKKWFDKRAEEYSDIS